MTETIRYKILPHASLVGFITHNLGGGQVDGAAESSSSEGNY